MAFIFYVTLMRTKIGFQIKIYEYIIYMNFLYFACEYRSSIEIEITFEIFFKCINSFMTLR